MSVLVDNANTWYVLFAIIAIGFAAMWWSQRRPRLLIGAAVGVGLIVALWLLTRFVVSDRQQIERKLNDLAAAAVEGKTGVFLDTLAGDFDYGGRKREDVAEAAVRAAKMYEVFDIRISSFDVEELTPPTAKVFFRVTAHMKREERQFYTSCRAEFVKEVGQWRIRRVRFFDNPLTQERERLLPLP